MPPEFEPEDLSDKSIENGLIGMVMIGRLCVVKGKTVEGRTCFIERDIARPEDIKHTENWKKDPWFQVH